ncbi:30S ribosomal protein S7, partial [bacterium]
MPRKGPAAKRELAPDPVYGSEMMARFINRLMVDGKKGTAEKIFYSAMKIVEERTQIPAVEAFDKAIVNAMPTVEVRPRRVGGQTYQVPMDVRPDRRRTLALRWLIAASRKRAGKTMIEKLAGELTDAANGAGSAIKKREDTHRMADSN